MVLKQLWYRPTVSVNQKSRRLWKGQDLACMLDMVSGDPLQEDHEGEEPEVMSRTGWRDDMLADVHLFIATL